MDFLSEAKRWAEQQGLKAALIDVSSRLRSASTSLQSNLLESSSSTHSSPSKTVVFSPSSSSSSAFLGSMDTPYILSYQQPIPGKPLSIPSIVEPNLRNTVNDNETKTSISNATDGTIVPSTSSSSIITPHHPGSTVSPSPLLSDSHASPLRSTTCTEHTASVNGKVPLTMDRTPVSTPSSSSFLTSVNIQRTPPLSSSSAASSLSISYPLNSSTCITTPLTKDSTIHGPSMQVPHLVNANIVGDEDGGLLVARIRELESQQLILHQSLADARARAATAEARCVTLESALERYAAQGASLEGQIEGLGTAMRQELSKMAMEVETATARAITAETALEEMKQIESNLRTEAANAAREAATVMDSFREQAEAAFLREQGVTAEVRKQIETLQNELKAAKAQTVAAETKATESASDASISQREAAAAREMAVTAEAHLAASQRELDRLRHEVAELTTRLITVNTNNTVNTVNNIVNLPPLPVSNPPSLNNSFTAVNSSIVPTNGNHVPHESPQPSSTSVIPPSLALVNPVWPLRKVNFVVHGTDTPTLVPLPPIDESVGVKVQGTSFVAITDNDVQRICPANKAIDSSSLAASNNENTDPNIEDISKLVHAGLQGRSGTIFIANAPSLGDLPLHQCIITTAKEIFSQLTNEQTKNTVTSNRTRSVTRIEHRVKISIIEVALDKSNHNRRTGHSNNEIIRDMLDIQQQKTTTDDTSLLGQLYAPIIPLEASSTDKNNNDTTVPVTSRALNIDVDTIEGIDALVEMALVQRAALRAQETPSSATTLEIAALTNRSHVIVTFAINHIARTENVSSTESGSIPIPTTTQFTSRIHIVQLACPAHIGLVSQAGTTNDINYGTTETTTDNIYNEPLTTRLSNEIVEIAKNETLFATNALQTLSNIWIKLNKPNTLRSNELTNRLALDTIANESTVTTVIADALSPSCGHLFCVHVSPRLSYTLDADAVAFFMAGSDMFDAIPSPSASVHVPLLVNHTPAVSLNHTATAAASTTPKYPQSDGSLVAEMAAATVATTVAAQHVLGRRSSNASSINTTSLHSLQSKISPSTTSVWTANGPTIVDLDPSVKYRDNASVRRASRQFNSIDNRSNIGTGLTALHQQRRRSTSSTGSRASLSNTNSYVPTIEDYIRSGGPEKAKQIVAAELDSLTRKGTVQTKRSTSTGKSTKIATGTSSTTLSQLLNPTTRDNDTASIASSSRRSTTTNTERRRGRSEERKGESSNAPNTMTVIRPTVVSEARTRSRSASKKRSSSVSSKSQSSTKEYLTLEEHMQRAMTKHNLGRSTTISLGEKSRTGLVVSKIGNASHNSSSKSGAVKAMGSEESSATKTMTFTSNNNPYPSTTSSTTAAVNALSTGRSVLNDLDAAIANEIQETLRLEQVAYQNHVSVSPPKALVPLQYTSTLPLGNFISSTSSTSNSPLTLSSSSNATLPAPRRTVQPPSPPSLSKNVPQSTVTVSQGTNSTVPSSAMIPSEPTNPVPAMRQLLFYAKAYFHQYSSLPEPFRLTPSHFDQLRAYLVSVAIDNRDNNDDSENTNGNIFLNSNSFTLALHKWIPSLTINQIYTLLELMGLNNVLTNTIDVMDFVDALEALANGEGY